MRFFFFSMLISLIWISLQYKQVYKMFQPGGAVPMAVPKAETIPSFDQLENLQSEPYQQMENQQAEIPGDLEDSKIVVDNLTDEQKNQLREIGIDPKLMTAEIHSPAVALLKKMNKNMAQAKQAGNIAGQTFGKYSSLVKKYYEKYNSYAPAVLAGFLAAILTMKVLGLWSMLEIFSVMFLKISNLILLFVSIVSFGFAYWAKANIWSFDSSFVLWFPACLMFLSAVGLKMYDMNFPVWRRVFSSIVFPVISMVAVTAWLDFLI